VDNLIYRSSSTKGGTGGFGVYKAAISAPYTQPYIVGGGGGGGNPTCKWSQAGQSSRFGPAPSPLITAGGGSAGGWRIDGRRYGNCYWSNL
jgi:hypothetical protein